MALNGLVISIVKRPRSIYGYREYSTTTKLPSTNGRYRGLEKTRRYIRQSHCNNHSRTNQSAHYIVPSPSTGPRGRMIMRVQTMCPANIKRNPRCSRAVTTARLRCPQSNQKGRHMLVEFIYAFDTKRLYIMIALVVEVARVVLANTLSPHVLRL